MPIHPLAAEVAAQLPPDCPEEVLVKAQREFAADVLGRALSKMPNYNSPDETAMRLRLAVGKVPTACSASILKWVKELAPQDYPDLLLTTSETRKQWAREQAIEFLKERKEWQATAADQQEIALWQIAEAWHESITARVFEKLCAAHESDKSVGKMPQATLFKWMLTQPPAIIARHLHRLSGKYVARFQAQFNPEQWAEIKACVAQPSEAQAARMAKASGKVYP